MAVAHAAGLMQLAELVRAEREAHVAAEALVNSRDPRIGADIHADATSPLSADNLSEMRVAVDGHAEIEQAKCCACDSCSKSDTLGN